MDKNYHSQFFCPYWGSESLPFEEFLSKVKEAGYDGVEMSLPLDAIKKNRIVDTISSHQLKFIGQHWETTDGNFETHLANYKIRLYNLADAKPVFINSQTGKDYYTFEQNAALIKAAAAISTETGIRVIHETHRGKFSFAAHITRITWKKYRDLNYAWIYHTGAAWQKACLMIRKQRFRWPYSAPGISTHVSVSRRVPR